MSFNFSLIVIRRIHRCKEREPEQGRWKLPVGEKERRKDSSLHPLSADICLGAEALVHTP
jgi:hypothetical protein